MPARSTRYNRQSRAIDQKSDSIKNRVVTKQTESKIQEARRNQQEKIEQREQERQEVIIQQEETRPTQSTSIITGQKFEQDQIGVVDDADDYKTAADIEIPKELEAFTPLIRGTVATGRGILAPTEQITQPVVDIASGVKAQDQAMPSTWLDLLITPIAAPLMMQKDFGWTEKDWYSPLGQVELWNRNESLPEFAQDTGDKRDFWTGMGDNLEILQTVLPNPDYHAVVNEGSFNEEGAMITPGYKQVIEVELQPQNIPYYVGTAIGEIPYFVIAPMKTVQLAANVAGTTVRIGAQSTLALKNIKQTASLKTATVNAIAEQAANKKNIKTYPKNFVGPRQQDGIIRTQKTETLVNEIKANYLERIKTAGRQLKALDDMPDPPGAKNLREAPVTAEKARLVKEIDTLKNKRNEIGKTFDKLKNSRNQDEMLDFQDRLIGEGNNLSRRSVGDILRSYQIHENAALASLNRKISKTKNEIKHLKSTKDYDKSELSRLDNALSDLQIQKRQYRHSKIRTADKLAANIENAPDAAHKWIMNKVSPMWSTTKKGVDGDIELTLLGRVAYSLTHKREGLSAFYNREPKALAESLSKLPASALRLVDEENIIKKENIPLIKQDVKDALLTGRHYQTDITEELRIKYNEPNLNLAIVDVKNEVNLKKLGKNVYQGTMGPEGEAINITDFIVMKGDTRQVEGLMKNLKMSDEDLKALKESRVGKKSDEWSLIFTTADSSTKGPAFLRISPGLSTEDFARTLDLLQVSKSPKTVPVGTDGRLKKTFTKVKGKIRKRTEKREKIREEVFEIDGKGMYEFRRIGTDDIKGGANVPQGVDSKNLIDEYQRLRFSLNPAENKLAEKIGGFKVMSVDKLGGDSATLTIENIWTARNSIRPNQGSSISRKIDMDKELSEKQLATTTKEIGELEAYLIALKNKRDAAKTGTDKSQWKFLDAQYRREKLKLKEMVDERYDEIMNLKYRLAELESIGRPTGDTPLDPFNKGKLDTADINLFEAQINLLRRQAKGEVEMDNVDDFIDTLEDGGTIAKLNIIQRLSNKIQGKPKANFEASDSLEQNIRQQEINRITEMLNKAKRNLRNDPDGTTTYAGLGAIPKDLRTLVDSKGKPTKDGTGKPTDLDGKAPEGGFSPVYHADAVRKLERDLDMARSEIWIGADKDGNTIGTKQVVSESVNSMKNKIKKKMDDPDTSKAEKKILEEQLKKIEDMYRRTKMHWWKEGGQYGVESGGVGAWRSEPVYKQQAVLNRLTLAGFQNVQQETRATGQSFWKMEKDVFSDLSIDPKRANTNPNRQLEDVMKERRALEREITKTETEKGVNSPEAIALRKSRDEMNEIELKMSALMGKAESRPMRDDDRVLDVEVDEFDKSRKFENPEILPDEFDPDFQLDSMNPYYQQGTYIESSKLADVDGTSTGGYYYKVRKPSDIRDEIKVQETEINKIETSIEKMKKDGWANTSPQVRGANQELSARNTYVKMLEQQLERSSNIRVVSLKNKKETYSLPKTKEFLSKHDVENMSKAEQDVVFAQWSKENKDYMVVMWDEEKYAKRVYHNGYDFLKLQDEKSMVKSRITTLSQELDTQSDIVYGGGTFRSQPIYVYDTEKTIVTPTNVLGEMDSSLSPDGVSQSFFKPGETMQGQKIDAKTTKKITGGTPKPGLITEKRTLIDTAIDTQKKEIKQIDSFLNAARKFDEQGYDIDTISKNNNIEINRINEDIIKIRDSDKMPGGKLSLGSENKIKVLEMKRDSLANRNKKLIEIRKSKTVEPIISQLEQKKNNMVIRLTNLESTRNSEIQKLMKRGLTREKAEERVSGKTGSGVYVTSTSYVNTLPPVTPGGLLGNVGWKTLRDLEKDRYRNLELYYLKPPKTGDTVLNINQFLNPKGQLDATKIERSIDAKTKQRIGLFSKLQNYKSKKEDISNISEDAEKMRGDMRIDFQDQGRFVIATMGKVEKEGGMEHLTSVKNWKTTRGGNEIEFEVNRIEKSNMTTEEKNKLKQLEIMKDTLKEIGSGEPDTAWAYIKQDQKALTDLGAIWKQGKWEITLENNTGKQVVIKGDETLPAEKGWRISDGEIEVTDSYHQAIDKVKQKAFAKFANESPEFLEEVEARIDAIAMKAIQVDIARDSAKKMAKRIKDKGVKAPEDVSEAEIDGGISPGVLRLRIAELEGELYENTISVIQKDKVPVDNNYAIETRAPEDAVTKINLNSEFFENVKTQIGRKDPSIGPKQTVEIDLMRKHFPDELSNMTKNLGKDGIVQETRERVWNRLLFNQGKISQDVDRHLIDMWNSKKTELVEIVPVGMDEIARKKFAEKYNNSMIGGALEKNRLVAERKREISEFLNKKLKVKPVEVVEKGLWREAKIGQTETKIQSDVWSGRQLTHFLSTDQISVLDARPYVSLPNSAEIAYLKNRRKWLSSSKGGNRGLNAYETERLAMLEDNQGNVYPNKIGGGVQWSYIRTGKLGPDIATGRVYGARPLSQSPLERRTDTVGKIAEYFAYKVDRPKKIPLVDSSKYRGTQTDPIEARNTAGGQLYRMLENSWKDPSELEGILKSNMEARNIVGNEADQARNIKLNTVREFVRSGRLTEGVDGSVLELVSKEDFKKILKGDNKLLEEKTANIIKNESQFNDIIKSMESTPTMINDGVKKLREPKINRSKITGREKYQVGDISLDRIGLQTSFGGVQTTQKTTLIDSLASYILRRTEGVYPLEQVQQVTSDRVRSQLLKDFIAINPSKKSSLSKTDKQLLERGTFLEPEYEKKLTQLSQKEFVGKDGKPKNLTMVPSKSGRDAIRKTGESSDEDFLKQFTDDPSAYAGPIMSEEYLMYGGRKPGEGVKQVMSREDAQKIMKAQSDRLDEARGIRKSEYDTEVQIEEIMQKDILAKYGGTFTPPKSLDEILSIRNKIATNKSEIAENNRRIENLKQSQKGDPDKLNKLENETENLIQETKNLEKADRTQTANITKMNPTDFVNQALFKSPSQLGEGFLPSSVMAYGATPVFLGDALPEAAAQIQPKPEEFTILPKPEPPTLKTTTMTSTATQQGQGQSGKVVPLEIQVPKLQDELKTGNVMDVVQKQFTPQMIRERVIQAPGLRTGLRAGAALTTPLITYQQAFATALNPPDTTQRLYIPKEAPRLTPPPKRPGPVAPFMLPPFIAATWDETEAQRQKKRKKRKAFWDVPDQWWKSGYWSMKPSSLTGKMDRLGAGYTTFKSTEPRRARKKKNQWDLY